MRLDLLDFALPEDRIATHPLAERDASRLLALFGSAESDEQRDLRVRDLPGLIPPESLLVVNNTKVLRARLLGSKPSGGRAEIFLLRPHEGSIDSPLWQAMGRASKSFKPGSVVHVGSPPELDVVVEQVLDDGLLLVRLNPRQTESVLSCVERLGKIPLPPYMQRNEDEQDRDRYQTVFASQAGAVAAPTAGLHLTEALLNELKNKGVQRAEVTLHVGLGTFRPVTVDDLDDHPMHAEWIQISEATRDAIALTHQQGGRVVAIGTTVVRTLESLADPDKPGCVLAGERDTNLLIQPGYSFRVVDSIMTNFHLPRSTLLALVCAFAGRQRVLKAYQHAIDNGYRFFSYGDAMWLDRAVDPKKAQQ